MTEPWGVGDYSEWLMRFLKAQNATQVHILAHSFGARVAFKTLYNHPDAAKSLIITGGAGIVKPRSREYLKKVGRYRRIKKIFPKFAERHFGSEEYRSLSPLMRESYKKIVNEDLSVCAASVKCRTYLLYGAEDKVTPPDEEGRIFNNLIKGSVLETMAGGHFCFSENPDLFNTKILSFLRGE